MTKQKNEGIIKEIMKTFKFIISNAGNITINVDGKIHSISQDHPSYEHIREAIARNDINAIIHCIDLKTNIVKDFTDNITFKNGEIFYKNVAIKNSLTKKIIRFYEQNLPVKPLIMFLENLVLNPSPYIVNELDLFFEKSNIALTEDGHFLAYKRIRQNWKDFHTDAINNSIGSVVTMNRSDVNSNRDHTCSHGLHVCSKSYLSVFQNGMGRIVIVKVNPRDVVSIPSDYHNQKMRCCKYQVIGEVQKQSSPEADLAVVNELLENDLYSIGKTIKTIKGKSMPQRGPDGKFIKKTQKSVSLKRSPRRGPDGKFIKITPTPVSTKGPQRDANGRFLKKAKS